MDIEVGGVAGLVAPGGGVQSRTNVQFVGERLAHTASDPEKLSFRYRNVKIVGIMRYEVPVSRPSYHHSITAVFVFNRVENLCLILHTNVLTLQTSLLTGLPKFPICK